jgi:hypothetical protein
LLLLVLLLRRLLLQRLQLLHVLDQKRRGSSGKRLRQTATKQKESASRTAMLRQRPRARHL